MNAVEHDYYHEFAVRELYFHYRHSLLAEYSCRDTFRAKADAVQPNFSDREIDSRPPESSGKVWGGKKVAKIDCRLGSGFYDGTGASDRPMIRSAAGCSLKL